MWKIKENQENPTKSNRLWRAGRLGPGIWLVKSPEISENTFPKIHLPGKSEKIHLVAPRAGSGRLGPAHFPKTPGVRRAQNSPKMSPQRPPVEAHAGAGR